MAINKYPYTNFNEYNLDWIIKTVKDLSVEWKETKTEWEDVQTEWENYKNYIDSYFENLDLSQEVSNKLDEMAANGTFTLLIKPFFDDAISEIPDVVTDWLDLNVDPDSGYVIDDSLSIRLAAADAKATGDAIKHVENELYASSASNIASYAVIGRKKFFKNTIIGKAEIQSGIGTLYKFTKNFFVIEDQSINDIDITHTSDGKLKLNGTASANTMITVDLPANLTGQFHGEISGSGVTGIYAYLRNSSNVIAAQMDLSNSVTNSFDRNVSNIAKYQLLIIGGTVLNDYILEASIEFLLNESAADNPYFWEPPTYIEQAVFPIFSDVDYFISTLNTTQILLDCTFLNGMKTVRVSQNASADFSSILDALKNTSDDTKIYVENGTYNIVNEYKSYYGNDFFTNYDSYLNHPLDPFYRGLWISDNRIIEFDPWVKIVWDYDGANSAVNGLFSVFALGQNATIIGANITFNTNCRYAIHDDFATFDGTNKIIRCIFNGTSSNGTTIGGGCGHRNSYVIKDCLFQNDGTYDISYHNTIGLGINHIVVSGCSGNTICKFGWYGSSTEITECIASNNKFGSITCEAHNSSAVNINMHLNEWNNITA